MEKEKKEISRKALIGIIVALIIIIIIAFGVIIFFVGRNTAQTENTLKSNVNNNEIDDTNSVKTSKRTLEPTEENIREQIAFFNENEDLGLEPTQEQINEIIEYAKDLEEYNDDILMEFILQKGWTVRGTQMIDYDNLTMPNLIGMNYGDIREYLDNNNLYFINEIKYRTSANTSLVSDRLIIPTTILSTIPEAGTKLDPYTDTSITVYSNYAYAVTTIIIDDENDDSWETKYFGKTIKVQVGENKDNYIQGTIGTNFCKQPLEYNEYSSVTKENFWDAHKQHRYLYVVDDDITKISNKPDTVNGKIWIDNQFVKEITFEFNGAKKKLRVEL